ALRHAAGDDELGLRAPAVRQVEDGVDRLLPSRVDERAGVHHDEVGVLGRAGGDEPVGEHRPGELVRVDLVLRAAQGLDPEGAGHDAVRVTGGAAGAAIRAAPAGLHAQNTTQPVFSGRSPATWKLIGARGRPSTRKVPVSSQPVVCSPPGQRTLMLPAWPPMTCPRTRTWSSATAISSSTVRSPAAKLTSRSTVPGLRSPAKPRPSSPVAS